MGKAVVKLENDLDRVKQMLSENTECYVLITCTAPADDGKMGVEMSYEGDEVLAAYLIDNAQQVFETNRAKAAKPR